MEILDNPNIENIRIKSTEFRQQKCLFGVSNRFYTLDLDFVLLRELRCPCVQSFVRRRQTLPCLQAEKGVQRASSHWCLNRDKLPMFQKFPQKIYVEGFFESYGCPPSLSTPTSYVGSRPECTHNDSFVRMILYAQKHPGKSPL